MVVVIDGYNLLRNVFHKEKGKLTSQREKLVQQLSYYKNKKKIDIIIVFDGGYFKHASREIKGGVVVIFSGQNSTADDWIWEYVGKHPSQDILLATEDRQLIAKCQKLNDKLDVIKVHTFYKYLQDFLLEEVVDSLVNKENGGEVIKYQHEEDDEIKGEVKSEALDFLMSQIDMGSYQKDEDRSSDLGDTKKGKAKALSQQKKRFYKKLKKL